MNVYNNKMRLNVASNSWIPRGNSLKFFTPTMAVLGMKVGNAICVSDMASHM